VSEAESDPGLTLRWNEPLAVAITGVVQRGQADQLRHLLDKYPGLARARAGIRLVERGARTNLYQASALGLVDRVRGELATDPRPDTERVTAAFWVACGGGHEAVAELLLAKGANINWVGWGDETPLDVARRAEALKLVAWLQTHGARSAAENS
jgi:uncharacterized protein